MLNEQVKVGGREGVAQEVHRNYRNNAQAADSGAIVQEIEAWKHGKDSSHLRGAHGCIYTAQSAKRDKLVKQSQRMRHGVQGKGSSHLGDAQGCVYTAQSAEWWRHPALWRSHP